MGISVRLPDNATAVGLVRTQEHRMQGLGLNWEENVAPGAEEEFTHVLHVCRMT